MEEHKSISYDGKLLAKNTIYNMLGYGLPLLLAIILLPPLIKNLGVERFAILNLFWIVVGYFSFLDFGIGKALTKIVAERISLKRSNEIPSIFWTAIVVMFGISGLASIILFFFVPSLLHVFEVSENLYEETKSSFHILVVAIPIVTTTAGLRGVLEAYQRFGTINVIRILMGIVTFLGPLVVFIMTKSMLWIVIFLVFIRLLIWIIYLINCFIVNDQLKLNFNVDIDSVKPVLKFSLWITLANLIGPIILYSDRVIIGALVEVSAITYYSTPYEVITKLMIIPTSLVTVMFPIFSSSYFITPELSKKYLIQGVKIIFLLIYPIVFITTMFAFEVMNLWLGENFAINSSVVLQYLAIGIMMNALSLIINNCLQGIGKPRIPTIINIIELPIYILVMWTFIWKFDIEGAAIAYMIMATIDFILMYSAAYKIFSLKIEKSKVMVFGIIMVVILIIPFLLKATLIKFLIAFFFFISFSLVVWNYFLDEGEKEFIKSRVRLNK